MLAAYTYFASGLPDAERARRHRLPAESTYVYDRTGAGPPGALRVPEPRGGHVRRAPRGDLAGDGRQRGPHLLGQQRRRLPGHRARRARQPRGRRDRAGRLDHHPAGDRLRARHPGGGRVDAGRCRRLARGERGRRRPRRARRPRRSRRRARPTSASRQSRTTRPTSRTRSARTSWPCRSRPSYPGREGKERILETYLNLIYYGNGSYGIKAAAANYFGLTNLGRHDDLAGRLPGRAAPGSLVPRPVPEPELDPRESRGRGRGTRSSSATWCWGPCARRGTSRPPRRTRPGPPPGCR